MSPSIYTLLLIPFATALPHIQPRSGYSASLSELKQSLQSKWTTPLSSSSSSDSSNSTIPSDPTSFYHCAGPSISAYPPQDQWLSWPDLWTINAPVITKANGGDTYTTQIQSAVTSVAAQSKIDARLILAIIMQESSGNLNVPCSGPTNQDCGLMQIRGGSTYASSKNITLMVEEGVFGTSHPSPGYLDYFNADPSLSWIDFAAAGVGAGDPYAAAHVYNVGGLSSSDLTQAPGWGGPNAYANDVVSRLMGWSGEQGGCEASLKCEGLGARKC